MTFHGVQITIVDAGTVVGKDHEGSEMIVTDTSVVMNGPRCWMTQRHYDLLKARLAADAAGKVQP